MCLSLTFTAVVLSLGRRLKMSSDIDEQLGCSSKAEHILTNVHKALGPIFHTQRNKSQ